MNYKITHTTTYSYSTPVSVCHNLVMLTPREGDRVHCQSHRLNIRPTPSVSARRKDYFGNQVHSFSVDKSHKRLTIAAFSRVSVAPAEPPATGGTREWENVVQRIADHTDPDWLNVCPFLFDSPRIERGAEFAEFARSSFRPRRPVPEAALDLVTRIHQDFHYDTTATTVSTPTIEAFRLQKGVCQDFAHVLVACFRSLGLAARYVSGYLRTMPPPGRPQLVGADQSHAWTSVYCGAGVGWLDLDPTNGCACTIDHIPVAWGRDYSDVVPIRGIFLGGGEHQLQVAVNVCPTDDPQTDMRAPGERKLEHG